MTETDDNKIAVVMAVNDHAQELEEHLEKFLNLPFNGHYRVIVVDEASTDDTSDVLKRMKAAHDNLYTTFLPRSVRNPSKTRLALTIGVKATTSPRVVLASINRPPTSVSWLQELSDSTAEIVMAYSNRKKSGITWRKQEHPLLEDATALITKAERRSGRGHCGHWMKYHRGMYDAVAVNRERIYDAIKLFDKAVGPWQLTRLRLHVFWQNLFN